MRRKTSAILTIVMLLGVFISLLAPWDAAAELQEALPAATGPEANAVNEQASLTDFRESKLTAPSLLLNEPRATNPALAAPNAEVAPVLTTAKQVVTGESHTCALTATGGVKCWGRNDSGQLGDGTNTDSSTPVDVSGLGSGVTSIAAGGSHTCALLDGGGVKCWGWNKDGQLGNGTSGWGEAESVPVDVVGLDEDVAAIVAGGKHTCALLAGGAAKCWGYNWYGQLGDGTYTNRSAPVGVSGLGSGAVAIAAGGLHTCALLDGGGVKCLGGNSRGQLGDGTTTPHWTPVDVSGLNSGVTAIAAGEYHTCALLDGGSVKCWGDNNRGQLGDGTASWMKNIPVSVSGLNSGVTNIAAGWGHTCALLADGGVKCWGNNQYWQLGDGTRTNYRSTPVGVSGLSSGVGAIAAGDEHTCALLTNGGVKCWGWNSDGQLGDGTITSHWTPVDVSGLGGGVTAIAAGGGHTCALLDGGGVKCWGHNNRGQLGDGTTTNRSTPVAVSGLNSGVAAIAAGGSRLDGAHTCALLDGGGVKCWGWNSDGQLGDGTTTNRSTPVDVIGLNSGVAAIAAGWTHSCALLDSGGVKCWGRNEFGQLGDGTTTNRSTPVDVIGLNSGVVAIAAGMYHTCALLENGGVKCWGRNDRGPLGDGTTTNRSTPVNVSGISSSIAAIAAGGAHTCALLDSGGVKCWGDNESGQLGDGTTTNRSTPVDVRGLDSEVAAIAAGAPFYGYGHTCALLTGGGVKCWGNNVTGALGVNPGWTPVSVVGFEGAGVSGPTTDPQHSSISVQPASLPADGVSEGAITVQLQSADGQPAWGKTVRLSSDRGVLDVISPSTPVTDREGKLTATIHSNTPGSVTITAFVMDDGVLLDQRPIITFESAAPPSDALLYRIDQITDTGIRSLKQIEADSWSIAQQGDYFRGALGEDSAKLATDIVFDMADVVAGVNQTPNLQKAMRLACPGCYIHGTWNVAFEWNHPDAARLLDTGFTRVGLQTAMPSTMAEFIGWGGMKYYAAGFFNWGISQVTKSAARDATRTIFARIDDGMTTIVYPTVHRTSSELTTLLQNKQDDLRANLPALSADMQRAYEDDLTGRTLALLVLAKQLTDERMTLENFRGARVNHSSPLLNFMLRFTAKSLAKGFFDGPGAAAVGVAFTAFDWHMDKNQLKESMQMYDLATGALLGAPDALRQTYLTASGGLNQIALGLPTHRAKGRIDHVAHYNQGSGWGPFWNETASWSEVTLTNTGDTETTYRVLASYLADTTRFGVPWATMNMVEEAAITLAPGASGVVRVDYKREHGAKGFSPRSKTCIPGAGCVSASSISIDVLGTNKAGTYYIGHDYSIWQPVRKVMVAASSPDAETMASESLPVIDPPLTAYVLSAPWTQQFETQLWINNPFTSTIPVTVTQPLPPDITVLDLGGAVQTGDTLTWNTVVSPTALSVITFTFSYTAAPGTGNILPPGSLTLHNPWDGALLTTEANPVDFQAIWPLTLDHTSPGYVLPGASSSVIMTATNWTDNQLLGTVGITVTDSLSNTVFTDNQTFDIAGRASSSLTFPLPTTLASGEYLIHGWVASQGASAEAFVDTFQVGAPGPQLRYQVSPTGPVHPGDVLTYTVQFTNTLGVPLSSAVLTASLPISTAILPASITGGGAVNNKEVRWPLGTVPVDGAVSESFAVRVDSNAAQVGGEPGRLFSEPRLTANEIAPTWGWGVWNLVTSPTSIQSIVLADGWTLLSFNRVTASAAVTEVMASVEGSYDRILGEDGSYVTALPPGFNTLREMSPGKAYWVHATNPVTLTLTGSLMPVNTPIELHTGWNWVGYLPQASMPVTQALASIEGKYTRVIGDDGSFVTSLPPSFNTLKTMEPGKGYLIYITDAATLTYPSDAGTFDQTSTFAAAANCTPVENRTTLFHEVYGAITPETCGPAGAMVTAHRTDGVAVGCFEIENSGSYGLMRIYQQDPNSPGIPALPPGECVHFRINGVPVRANGSDAWCPPAESFSVDQVELSCATTPPATDHHTWLPLLVH